MSLAAIHWLEEARTRSAAQDCPRLYPHWVRLCRRPQSLSALHPSCPCSEYGWTGFQSLARRCSMQVGLRLANISYEGQKVVELKYKDHYVGEGYPDLVVHLCDEKLIVELKAICGELGASEDSNPGGSRGKPKWTFGNWPCEYVCQPVHHLLAHRSFAYSALACLRMGMSESASFHRVRKSRYAAFAPSTLPAIAFARPKPSCART